MLMGLGAWNLAQLTTKFHIARKQTQIWFACARVDVSADAYVLFSSWWKSVSTVPSMGGWWVCVRTSINEFPAICICSYYLKHNKCNVNATERFTRFMRPSNFLCFGQHQQQQQWHHRKKTVWNRRQMSVPECNFDMESVSKIADTLVLCVCVCAKASRKEREYVGVVCRSYSTVKLHLTLTVPAQREASINTILPESKLDRFRSHKQLPFVARYDMESVADILICPPILIWVHDSTRYAISFIAMSIIAVGLFTFIWTVNKECNKSQRAHSYLHTPELKCICSPMTSFTLPKNIPKKIPLLAIRWKKNPLDACWEREIASISTMKKFSLATNYHNIFERCMHPDSFTFYHTITN